MTEKPQRESAKIYQFPLGGRAGLEAERGALDLTPRADVVCDGSWYHDEAVRAAKPIVQR